MVEPTLERLQAMVQRVLDNQHKHTQDLHEIRDRMTHVETLLAGICRDQGIDAEAVAHVQARMDRLSDRVDRIERRLDLRDE